MKSAKRLLAMVLAVVLAVGGLPTVFAAELAPITETAYINGHEEERFFVSAEEQNVETLVLEVGESIDLTVFLGEEIMLAEISSDEDFVLISPNVLTEDGIVRIEGLDLGESDVTIAFWTHSLAVTTTPSALTTPDAFIAVPPNYSNGTQATEDAGYDDKEVIIKDDPTTTPEETTMPIIKTIRVYVIESMVFAPLSFNAPTFFDDFTVDTLFWDIPNVSMRRHYNALITNVPDDRRHNMWSRAQTRGRQWDNFNAIIDFTITSPPQTYELVVFHIRYMAENNNLGIMVTDDGIFAVYNWAIFQRVAYHNFIRGEMHRIKIEAYNEFVNVYVWCDYDNNFIQLNTSPIIHGTSGQPPQAGSMVMRSWLTHINIDSVTIIDTNPTEFFFADSFVRVELGSNPQIVPTNDTVHSITSISFSSDKPDVISVAPTTGVLTAHKHYIDYVQITATAVMSNGETITVYYHAVVYIPFSGQASFILHQHHPNHNQILRVGDTMNLNLFTQPVYVSDVQFTWTTTHPHAMQFVGNTPISRGVRALAPANNITVRATHPPTGLYTETTFDILPATTGAIDRVFTIDNMPNEIPSHFWGVNAGQSIPLINSYFHYRAGGDNALITEVQYAELEFLRSIQPQSIRFIFEHWETYNHPTYGIRGTHVQHPMDNTPVSLEEVTMQANALGIPLFFTTSTLNTPSHKVEVISAALEIIDARPLIVTIMNEPHDPTYDSGHMIGRNPPATVQDYMAFVRYVATAIRTMYPHEDIIISVCTNPDAQMWVNPADINTPGTLAHRLVGWNEYLALPQNQYYFDAVAMFSYSNAGGPAYFGGITTDTIMEGFAIHSARELEILNRQRTLFPDKQLWFVEFGDLPSFIWQDSVRNNFAQCDHIRARLQYMKSLGNAIGYAQRQMRILDHGVADMFIYYNFNHTIFGIVQPNWDARDGMFYELVAMPSYHVFTEMGRIFNEHTHFYSIAPPTEIREHANIWFGSWAGSYPWTGNLNLDFYRLSGLAFGDEYGARQVVFVNTSAYAANISIPSYYFRKTWSYGDGSNPLPDFAVNPVSDWGRHPHYVPTPTIHSGGFTDTLFVPAYSMVVADIGTFYPVTVAPAVAAYVSVSPATARVGDTITVTITQPAGQRLVANGVTATNTTSFTGNTVGSTSVTFAKTTGATEVNATFENLSGNNQGNDSNNQGGSNQDGDSGDSTPSRNYAWITPSRSTFDTANPQDIVITLYSGDFSFRYLRFGNVTLERDRDFTVTNNRFTIKADFISTLELGQRRLTFQMNGGSNPTLAITIVDGTIATPQPTPEPMPTPQPTPTPIPFPFIDVIPTAWYYPFVRAVWEQQLFQGTSYDTFSPQGSMTRAMFVQVLANLENVDLSVYRTQTATFNDTSPNAWYFAAIEWAVSQGLVSGVGNGNFAPNRPITREEMAVMLNRYIVSRGIVLPQGETSLFADQNSISYWAIEGVTAIQAAGLITGHPDGRFAPQDTATRAEVATIFARFLIVADLPRRDGLSIVQPVDSNEE